MEDNKEIDGICIPTVVKFAFKELRLLDNDKWSAKCKACGKAFVEKRRTTSAFTK